MTKHLQTSIDCPSEESSWWLWKLAIVIMWGVLSLLAAMIIKQQLTPRIVVN